MLTTAAKEAEMGTHLEDLNESNPYPVSISSSGVWFFRKCKKTDLKMAVDWKNGFCPLSMRNAMVQVAGDMVVEFHPNLTWKFVEVKL